MMKITLRYYGSIADVLNKNMEELTLDSPMPVQKMIEQHFSKSSNSHEAIHRVAINNQVVDSNTEIKNGDVIDLMPAFAGG